MKIEFDELVSQADWTGALRKITLFARKAVRARNARQVTQATRLLNEFIDRSPPVQWWSTGLDRRARALLGELAVDRVRATNDSLGRRTGKLRKIAAIRA